MFSPELHNDVSENTFPVFAKSSHKLTIADIKVAFRSHYDGTKHDPYLNNNPKEPYRPISIFRTLQTHIIQIRPELPKEIGCLIYEAMGMADLGVFIPLYQGVKKYPKAYSMGNGHADKESAYWKFRKVMTLAMVNYNKYAPVVKEKYATFETETEQRQHEMEEKYLNIYKEKPMEALDLLQQFSDDTLNKALHIADNLQDELFTELTADTQKEYLFHGA